MLDRVLEPEVMDSADEARDYNNMDHSTVNDVFTDDLIAYADSVNVEIKDVLDLGTGTALIPIMLCGKVESCRVMAVDMAIHMLDLARYNVEAEGVSERVTLAKVDAKSMGFDDGMFDVAISNSIVHHIPNPIECLREAVRVTDSGGLLFVRDLMRPESDEQVRQLVELYTGQENAHSQQMFDDSLRAALSLEEIRSIVVELGFDEESVQATTDRHWTWAAKKN